MTIKKEHPVVVNKKLGRKRAWGTADIEKMLIELDSRLVGKGHLDTILHELFHIECWEWSENRVKKAARRFTKILWDLGYRKVDNKERQNSR